MRVHSTVGPITNSSSELFSVLKPGAISEARKILKDALREFGMLDDRAMDMFDVRAEVACGFGTNAGDIKEFTCRTDKELREAMEYMAEVQYPVKCELHVTLGDKLDLAHLFNSLHEMRSYMQ